MLQDLLKKTIDHANAHYDGHLTIMKFTTNYRVCYGTIESRDQIDHMRKGDTVGEALKNLMNDPIDIFEINEILKES